MGVAYHWVLLGLVFPEDVRGGSESFGSLFFCRLFFFVSLAQVCLSVLVGPLMLWGIASFSIEDVKGVVGERLPSGMLEAAEVLAEIPPPTRNSLVVLCYFGSISKYYWEWSLASLRARLRRNDFLSEASTRVRGSVNILSPASLSDHQSDGVDRDEEMGILGEGGGSAEEQ
uniref:Uncharacterized protein n=1 Tax=Chromera velia CCMP2878 TaxID=1169474 RepID=A0A0G4FIJ6_9ALVE|eukprot:Cvel_17211.t1-p1 / transcript=Cvel_17211.t1 / gene=Cvel_17211 / organism=Chromera_velia_CCMP2878 / gene_product=hypothetical protein / transcript_product=hypothetical protein / location=Cvel_scaffold1361:30077-30589(+) / protein_length=171 / sequence_SO=supercontig / SO=protein_coding / is_pseudo=false